MNKPFYSASSALTVDVYIPHEDHTIGTLLCAMVEELAWRAPNKLQLDLPVSVDENMKVITTKTATIEACGYKMMSRVIVYPFPAGIVLNLVLSNAVEEGRGEEQSLTPEAKRCIIRHLARLIEEYSDLSKNTYSLGDLRAKLLFS